MLFTRSPYLLQSKLSQRGKQKGSILDSYIFKVKNNIENKNSEGIAWLENLICPGKNTAQEINESFIYAIKLATFSKKTLFIRLKPGTDSSSRKRHLEKIIVNYDFNFVFHDEKLDVLDLGNHCDSMVWSFGSSFFKLLPFIPIVYLQDKPRKLLLQDSRFLSYEYSLSSLASVWGQTKPEDAFNIYIRNEYEIQKRLSDWRRETLDFHYKFTNDKDDLRKSWLKTILN